MQHHHKQYLTVGDEVRVELPYSEVCMHMQVAGTVRRIRLVSERAVQILNEDGTDFSFPITTGEAGVYSEPVYVPSTDEDLIRLGIPTVGGYRYYTYPALAGV